MNQTDFHDKLSFLSESPNEKELIHRVLNKQDKDPIIIDTELVEKVSSVIEDFIDENANQLTQHDIPALNKLKNTVHCMLEGKSYHSNTLKSTIDAAVKVASKVIKIKLTPSDDVEVRIVLPSTVPDNLIL